MKTRSNQKRKQTYWRDYLYIAPAVAFVGIYFISSIIYSFHLSFFEWDGFSEKVFVGLSNYAALFRDRNFLLSVANTLVWVVCSLVTQVAIPLLFEIMITRSSFMKQFKNVF